MASKFISSNKDLYFGKGPVERENLPNEMLTEIFSYLDIKVRFCQKTDTAVLSYRQKNEHFIFQNLRI